MMSTQYNTEIKKLKDQIKNNLPALDISKPLLDRGVRVVSPSKSEYQIYIPIHLHYKHIVTEYSVWTLKKDYQRVQDGYLLIAVDMNFNFRWGWIYDTHFQNTVELFHALGDGDLCLGSYQVKMTRLEDIVRVRDEIQKMYETINTESISTANIHTTAMDTLAHEARNAPFEDFDIVYEGEKHTMEDADFSKVATDRKDKETKGKVWETGEQ